MLRKSLKNAKLTLSVPFIFLGLCLISYTYFATIKSNVFNYKNIKLIEQSIVLNDTLEEINEEQVIKQDEVILEEEQNEQEQKQPTTSKRNNYIGYLNVPDVNIKRGFVSPDSKYNKVNYNVTIIEGSTMPDVKNGNFILAAHRGSSSVSFFDKLYKIKDGAYAYVTYNGKVYKYKLVNRYTEAKDGSLMIKRNRDKTILTLITCTRNDKKTQTVFIFELVSVERG